MKVVAFGTSDTGIRDNNEDALLIEPELGLYVVSDGMGGHAGGDIASAAAVTVIRRYFREKNDELDGLYPTQVRQILQHVSQAVELACLRVNQLARKHAKLAGMGATLTMLKVIGQHAFVAHVGDSRIYLKRGGTIEQVSRDHTIAAQLVQEGLLNEEEASNHDAASVLTRAIGQQEGVQVDTMALELQPNDTFLLCSDGLGGHVGGIEGLGAYLDQPKLEAIPGQLIALAKANGSTDNITALVVRAESDPGATPLLFETLERSQLSQVLKTGQVQVFQPGQLISPQVGPNDRLFIVLSGEVVLTVNDSPMEIGSKRMLRASSLLGLPLSGSIRSNKESKVLVIPATRLRALMAEEPAIASAIWSSLARHLGAIWARVSGGPIVL